MRRFNIFQIMITKGKQDREQDSELDTMSVDTLDELEPDDREWSYLLSLLEDPTPCTDDGII